MFCRNKLASGKMPMTNEAIGSTLQRNHNASGHCLLGRLTDTIGHSFTATQQAQKPDQQPASERCGSENPSMGMRRNQLGLSRWFSLYCEWQASILFLHLTIVNSLNLKWPPQTHAFNDCSNLIAVYLGRLWSLYKWGLDGRIRSLGVGFWRL